MQKLRRCYLFNGWRIRESLAGFRHGEGSLPADEHPVLRNGLFVLKMHKESFEFGVLQFENSILFDNCKIHAVLMQFQRILNEINTPNSSRHTIVGGAYQSSTKLHHKLIRYKTFYLAKLCCCLTIIYLIVYGCMRKFARQFVFLSVCASFVTD